MHIYNKKISRAILLLYSLLSFVIWIYKRWITNGDMNTFATYMTTVYGIVMSLLAIKTLHIVFETIITYERIDNSILWVRGWPIGKKKLMVLVLLSIYYGFAMSGWYSIFSSELSIRGIVKIFLVSIWCFPQLLTYIYFFQWMKEWLINNRSEEIDEAIAWKLFVVAFVFWSLIYVGLWPGGLPYDANLEIDTAMGNVPFSSWQPYIHVYFVRLALLLGKHISMFFMMQIAFEAVLLSSFLGFVHRIYRVRRKHIYFIHFFILIQMPVFSLGMELLRDSIFSLGFAWLVFLLISYDEKKDEIRCFYIQLFIAFFIVSTMRSNGIIALITLAPIFIRKGYKKDRNLMTIAVATVACYILIFGPLAKEADVKKLTTDTFVATSAIDDMRAVKYFGGEIPEEADRYLESIKIDAVEHWYDNYSDQQFNRTYDATNASTAKIIKYYVWTFIKNPYYVIKNRLTKSSVIWEIFGHGEKFATSYLSVNKRGDYYFFDRVEGAMTPYADAVRRINEALYADFLTLRSGIYIVLMLLLMIYSDDRKKYITAFVTILVNILALIYGLNYHERRYIYWIVLCVVIMISHELIASQTVKDS